MARMAGGGYARRRVEPNYEALLATAAKLREQCNALRANARRLREQATQTIAESAEVMKRAQQLYEDPGRRRS